jgi:hypothetical protein
MASVRTDKVIAYYANPETGKVEKHEMTSVTYEEASRAKTIQGPRGRPVVHKNGEEHLWVRANDDGSMPAGFAKGTKPEDIVDFTPMPFDVKAMDSAPPPALQRDSLRERAAARG